MLRRYLIAVMDATVKIRAVEAIEVARKTISGGG